MKLNHREKMIALGVGLVLALFVLDQLLLSPMFVRLATADDSIARDSQTLEQSNGMKRNGDLADVRWRKMSEGHIGTDASAAQSQLLNHMNEVARNTGVNLTSIKPEHGEKAQGFARTGFRASANVTMSTLVSFLLRLESPDLPIRVTDLQIKSNKPGVDDLTVDLGISTIYKLSAAEEAK